MCEVRRVFHNVNSDPKKVIPFTKSRKPVVHCYEPSNIEITTQHFENKEELPCIQKENGITSAVENSKASKNRNSVQSEFSEPKLLTSLKIIESLKNIGNGKKTKKLPKFNFQRDSNNCKQKASRKVNIPFEEKVYKGLIDLQVTDEDLGLCTNLPLKPKEYIKIREPEPVLSDFYKPKFDKEYIVKPTVPKFEVNPVLVAKIPSVLAITKNWEPEES